MGTIGASTAALPNSNQAAQGGGGSQWPSLSNGAAGALLAGDVPESVIGIANDVIGQARGPQATMTPQLPTTPQTPVGTWNPRPLDVPTTPTSNSGGMIPVDTSSLNEVSGEFPGLINAHVELFRAIGTPDAFISTISNMNPNSGYIDQYIQSEIMQNPEGWDAACNLPSGTTRKGLIALFGPTLQLPAPGAGNPGFINENPLGTTPSLTTTPVGEQQRVETEDDDFMKMIVIGGLVIGGLFLAHRFMKGRGAQEGAEIVGSGGGGLADKIRNLGKHAKDGVEIVGSGRGVIEGGAGSNAFGNASALFRMPSVHDGTKLLVNGNSAAYLNLMGTHGISYSQALELVKLDAAVQIAKAGGAAVQSFAAPAVSPAVNQLLATLKATLNSVPGI